MALGEFDLIKRYFTPKQTAADVLLGVGDDAAVLAVPDGYRLVAAVDTIVAGVHFPLDTGAADIAYRALAVNLSDMAAMGAIPRWFTLSLCLPHADATWLNDFSTGLLQLAERYDVRLVGGDTVKGPLNISVQILGIVETDGWLTRTAAQPGDVVFVSGMPGEAAGGLRLLQSSHTAEDPCRRHLLERFYHPTPRIQLGRRIRKLANAAMDVSDGLLADLGKLCDASGCGAHVDVESLPISSTLSATFGRNEAMSYVLSGGDDYELVFTVSNDKLLHLEAALADLTIRCTPIGRIVESGGVQCFRDGNRIDTPSAGFDHFGMDD